MSNKNMTVAHIASDKQFAHANLYKNKLKGGYEWDYPQLHFFLTERGYFIYRTSKTKFIIIRILDNIVKEVGKKEIVDEILNFLLNVDKCHDGIHQFALKDMYKAISDDVLISLPEKQVKFRKDRQDAMQLYFQNCIVKITASKISTHPYSALDGYIWESQILQRQFGISENIPDSDFKKFCLNISANDNERFLSICSMLGFLIHNYKNPKYCPAVILNDEVISDNPEGGTGKGILIKAVMKFMQTTVIEGKTFSFDKGFVYQNVNADTKILAFQDVKTNFDFERLFSVLTDGITVEKKGLQAIHYGFEDSPKIIISTNRAIKGNGNSHKRRRFEVEISQHYNEFKTPGDDFKKMFFNEWDELDYLSFDTFIIQCCQLYLQDGLKHQILINLPEKKLMTETNSEFLEFMEDFRFDFEIGKRAMLDQFISAYPKYRHAEWLTLNHFTKWVVAYCNFHKITVDTTGRDREGKIRVYKFNNFIKSPDESILSQNDSSSDTFSIKTPFSDTFEAPF